MKTSLQIKMSVSDLPCEILQNIFGYLRGPDVIRCREVCHSWRDSVDALSDSAWQQICKRESYADDYSEAQSKYGLSWRDTYKALNSWSNINTAEIKESQLDITARRFHVLPKGILAILQDRHHDDFVSNKIYCNTIVYYNLETSEECSRHEFDFDFSWYQCDINEHLVAMVLKDGRLCIIPRANKKQFFVGTLAKYGSTMDDYFEDFTVIDKEVYFKNAKDEIIYVSKLIEKDGEISVTTEPLEAFKENHTDFEETVVAYSLKDGYVNLLTNQGNIYIHKDADFEWVGNFDCDEENIFDNLEEYGFDWRSQAVYGFLASDSPRLINSNKCALYVHARYGTGLIILLAATFFSKIKIFNSKNNILCLRDLHETVKCKPVRTIDMRQFIYQLDIVETPTTHKILVLRHTKILIYEFEFKPTGKKSSRAKKRKLVPSLKTLPLKKSKQQTVNKTYKHNYATRSKSKL